MKNFNLDNLEKKTPYQIPENFFEDLQKNVLSEVENKSIKKTRIFKLNFSVVTSIAAALALIFGFTFLWRTNQTDLTQSTEETTSTQANQKEINPNANINVSTNNTLSSANTNQKSEIVKPKSPASEIATQIVYSNNTDENYDQLLNALTEEELAELTKNTDHDIYLDLYN